MFESLISRSMPLLAKIMGGKVLWWLAMVVVGWRSFGSI